MVVTWIHTASSKGVGSVRAVPTPELSLGATLLNAKGAGIEKRVFN